MSDVGALVMAKAMATSAVSMDVIGMVAATEVVSVEWITATACAGWMRYGGRLCIMRSGICTVFLEQKACSVLTTTRVVEGVHTPGGWENEYIDSGWRWKTAESLGSWCSWVA